MQCAYHPTWNSKVFCEYCGLPLCVMCEDTYVDGSIMCKKCAKKFGVITYNDTIVEYDERISISQNVIDMLLSGAHNTIPKIDYSTPHIDIPVSDYYRQATELRKNTSLKKLLDFVAIDIETTGLHAQHDKILQVSAVRFKNFKLTEVFSTYINPRRSIPESATEINGITDNDVVNAPEFTQIRASLDRFIGSSTIVGHNIFFDLKFLRKNGYDSELVNRSYYDTYNIMKRFEDTENHKLHTLCKAHQIYPSISHSAVYDAFSTGLLFICCIKHYMSDIFSNDIDDELNTYDKYKAMVEQIVADVEAQRQEAFQSQTMSFPKYIPQKNNIVYAPEFPVVIPEQSNNLIQNTKQKKNKYIALLLCIFLGYIGAHKFYEDRFWMGVLYMLTFGIFFIGVVVDIIALIKKPKTYYV